MLMLQHLTIKAKYMFDYFALYLTFSSDSGRMTYFASRTLSRFQTESDAQMLPVWTE